MVDRGYRKSTSSRPAMCWIIISCLWKQSKQYNQNFLILMGWNLWGVITCLTVIVFEEMQNEYFKNIFNNSLKNPLFKLKVIPALSSVLSLQKCQNDIPLAYTVQMAFHKHRSLCYGNLRDNRGSQGGISYRKRF